ncbi:DDE superendonuclease family protein [Orientia tsutsugamushi str. UT76]|nr:DDE superendonuclease family protein [Orientia tsutsugamushi str. UT76]
MYTSYSLHFIFPLILIWRYKAVKWVEDTLVKHLNFALPGRKALMKSDMNYEVVLIDATESPT